ncbi:MAG TPA: UDP-2,3-diacylglucosamine diphosphatase [Micropepsaceae bacterium]|nr:UDP-2,3-diacylglucosamine diphosphatase [Micropepsaceae bacterium]
MRSSLEFPASADVPPHTPKPSQRIRRHRTIFISDTHLGTRGCKAELLADFLNHNECQTLYLVGDIIDGWRLKESWYWSPAHSAVVNIILRKVQEGTRVIYVPGNHDEVFREYCGVSLAGVELKQDAIHETADGLALWVVHGDHYDSVVTYARWLAHLGDKAYDFALVLNDWFNALRRFLGLPYWSLSAYLKHKVKNAASFISNFEHTLAREARIRGLDGVVAGHIHHPESKLIDGILYCNDGDWVESCTALTEDARGHMEIVYWTRFAADQRLPREATAHVPASYAAA